MTLFFLGPSLMTSSGSAGRSSAATLTDSSTSASGASSYTFASQDIGTAATDRYVVVGIMAQMSGTTLRTISSVTIGGSSAVIVKQQAGTAETIGGGDGSYTAHGLCGIAIRAVPTGTTTTVIVNFSGAAFGCGIAVYALDELTGTTAFDTLSDTTVPLSGAITIPAGGVSVAAAVALHGASGATAWSGFTERFDTTIAGSYFGGGGAIVSSANYVNLAAEVTPTCAATFTGALGCEVMVAASW